MLSDAAEVQRPSLNSTIFNPAPAHASVLTIRAKDGVQFSSSTLAKRLIGDIHQWLTSSKKFPHLPLTLADFYAGVERVADGSRAVVSSRTVASPTHSSWHFTLRHFAELPFGTNLVWRVRGVVTAEDEQMRVTTVVDCGSNNEFMRKRPTGILATTPRFLKDWVVAKDSLRVASEGFEQFALTNFAAEDSEQHASIMRKLLLSERRKIPVIFITPNLIGDMPISPERTRTALGTSSIVIGATPSNFNAKGGRISEIIKEVAGAQVFPAGIYVFLPLEAGHDKPQVEDYDMRSRVDIVNGYLRRVAGDTLRARIGAITTRDPLVATDLLEVKK